MFSNYLKIALRNIRKYKGYSFINISGLAIGLSVIILICLFVQEELSYDTFNEKLDNIYRLTFIGKNPDGSSSWSMGGVTVPHGPAMKEFFPEVKHFTRRQTKDFIIQKDKTIFKESILLVDRDFFEIFSFPLIKGSPGSVLSDQKSVVLTEEYAIKYFGNNDPVGETLTIGYGDYRNEFIVTGVVRKPPSNSTFQFNIMLNFECQKLFGMNDIFDFWGMFGTRTFIEVEDSESAKRILDRYPLFTQQYYSQVMKGWRRGNAKSDYVPFAFGLQKMKDVHLDEGVDGSPDLSVIYILSGIALIILFVACVNYIILSIGKSTSRLMEIGIRKVSGAQKKQLIIQFWSESILITGFAVITGVGLAYVLLPVFNELVNVSLNYNRLFSLSAVIILIFVTVFLGVLIGSFPAIAVSRFRPIDILRYKLKLRRNNYLTKIFVVMQFALSAFLIVSTLTMGKQINYMINNDGKFDRDGILIIETLAQDVQSGLNLLNKFRDRLESNINVINITGGSRIMGKDHSGISALQKNGKRLNVYDTIIDYDFFKTFGIEIIKGRDFVKEISSDKNNCIVNNMFVKKFELDNPIGEQIILNGDSYTIIGVVDDYHAFSMKETIMPGMHVLSKENYAIWDCMSYMYIKISGQNIPETIKAIQTSWEEYQPYKPFACRFLEDDLKTEYKTEQRWSAITKYATVFAVFIACMGILGLITMTISKRLKEIGVRKVFGAGVINIILLISNQSVKWILTANLLAIPVSWFVMNKWLQNFAFRTNIDITVYFVSMIFVLTLALVSISFQSIKAALANPVDSLRYE